MEQWYTLHTKPNAEYQVAASLQQRGIITYLPEVRHSSAGKPARLMPFFPCYLFIKTDFNRIGLSSVRWTPGLRRVVIFDEQPVPLKDDLIDLIRQQVNATGHRGGCPTHGFKPGDPVRITDGPFKDQLAVFDGANTPDERVQVLLNILGHASRYQISVSALAKAPEQAEVAMPTRPRRTRGRGRRITPS
jgi:transcription antitermination factor NusG